MNIEGRYQQHIKAPHSEAVANWLRGLTSPPVLEVVFESDVLEEQYRVERELISQHKNLLNLTAGGGGLTDRVPSELVSTRLPADVVAVLRKEAAEKEWSLSQLLAKIVREWCAGRV